MPLLAYNNSVTWSSKKQVDRHAIYSNAAVVSIHTFLPKFAKDCGAPEPQASANKIMNNKAKFIYHLNRIICISFHGRLHQKQFAGLLRNDGAYYIVMLQMRNNWSWCIKFHAMLIATIARACWTLWRKTMVIMEESPSAQFPSPLPSSWDRTRHLSQPERSS